MDFSFKLAAQILADEIDRHCNVLVSPISIAVGLHMLGSGSKGKTLEHFLRSFCVDDLKRFESKLKAVIVAATKDAPTKERELKEDAKGRDLNQKKPLELSPERHKPLTDESDSTFRMSNVILVDDRFSIKPTFSKRCSFEFKALVHNVDMVDSKKVRNEVNTWVRKGTKDLVKEVLSPTDIVLPPISLISQIYFKGALQLPHTSAVNSIEGEFHLLDGESTTVQFMNLDFKDYLFASLEQYKLLKLPFRYNKPATDPFSIYIFLPHRKDGLRDLVAEFSSDPESLHPRNILLEFEEVENVIVPNMVLNYGFDAKDAVNAKGLSQAFDPNLADFTNLAEGRNVYLGSMFHKASLKVEEKGKKVAISPNVTQKPTFKADHPFLFMIFSSSWQPLYVGTVLNPISM